ncbi:MAG: CZB domain-containing protein [Alphaproteobacteria bacterium]|nr:CZB domain-containing protein [Alphaproteobacteria bacterium]MDE2629427.1 CZB domain-containing protein [Alphaproteobacteria bacterium]
MDLDEAICAHIEWKMKFRLAISSEAQLDADKIGQDTQCPLGQWLHGEAQRKYGRLSSYENCLKAHASFHREAEKVARLINAKDYRGAQAALAMNTPLSEESNAMTTAIGRLKEEAAAG